MFEHLMWIYSTLVQASAAIVAVGGTVTLFMKEQYARRKQKNDEEVFRCYSILRELDTIPQKAVEVAKELIQSKNGILNEIKEGKRRGEEEPEAFYMINLLQQWVSFRENPPKWPIRSISLMGFTAVLTGILILIPEGWYPGCLVDYAGAVVGTGTFAVGVVMIILDFQAILRLP